MSAKPRFDVDRSTARLERLGLAYAADALPTALSSAVKQSTSAQAFLDELLEDELSAREKRRIKTALRLSNLTGGQTLARFDFGFQPAVERSRIETLATGAWIKACETLLIQGPPVSAGPTWPSVSASRPSNGAFQRSSTAPRSAWSRSRQTPIWRQRDFGARST